MRWLLLVCLLGCAAEHAHTPAPSPVTSALHDDSDPPPEFHAHPEVPPDPLPATEACPSLPTPPPAPKAASVLSGPPVTNHFPPEVIMRPMRTRAACLRQCYELGREPKDEGRVVLQFVVDVDGFVRRSKVRESELQDHAVAQCAARQIVGLQFPAPGAAPITIVYPFVFRR